MAVGLIQPAVIIDLKTGYLSSCKVYEAWENESSSIYSVFSSEIGYFLVHILSSIC
jgi:hypothetical protein